jgi:hypothetical protein
MRFNNNERTRTHTSIDKNRINLCEKSIFKYAESIFNELPKNIINENNFRYYKI